jgi:hypothetical protein
MWNDRVMADSAGLPPAAHDDTAWTGPRPRVTGAPVVVGAVLIGLVIVVITVTLTRSPDIVAKLSLDYVSMMAGQLVPEREERDPQALAGWFGSHLPAAPRIVPLEPEFTLLGGRRHTVDGRRAAAWFYESPTADRAIAEAVDVRLADMPEPDETRTGAGPPLHVYRKQTQTLVVWEEGGLVYVFISTLPGERVIALARRLASPIGDAAKAPS